MADKSFGVDQLDILGTGTPTISAPNQLNLDAHTVAISTSVTVGEGMSAVNISATGISTIAQPANSNPMANWTITNNSASAYRFTGPGQSGSDDNPDLYLVRGHRYIFKHNATTNHPIQIRVANGGAAYTDGITYSDTGNNRTTDGNNLIINLQHDAPARLFYQCTAHGSMVGNIYTVGGPQVISGVVTATTFSGSGASLTNLPAGNLTGTLPAISGANLTNLPVPTTITVADESSDTTCNPLFVTTTTGNLAPKTGTNLVFNSSSGNLRTGSLFLGTGSNESKTQDGLILERNSGDGLAHITAGRSGGNYSGMNFYVAGASGVTLRHLIDYESNFRWYAADGTTERLRIVSDGNLQFNNYSGNAGQGRISFGNSGPAFIEGYDSGNAGSGAYLRFQVTNNEKVRIPRDTWGLLVTDQSSTGNTGGYQTSGVSLREGGDSTFVMSGAPAVTMTRKINAGKVLDFYSNTNYAGGVYVNGQNSAQYQSTSDYRLKEDITSMTDGIDKVKLLNPVYYKNKQIGDITDTTTVNNGFLAHEVQSVIPTLVDGEKDAPIDERGKGYQTLNYAGFAPTTIAAIKELIAKVETLEAKVAALEGS